MKPNSTKAKRHHLTSNISEQVYNTLLDHLLPECSLSWVKPIFVPGNPCYEAYNTMYQAYIRVCGRLGVENEDEDVEIIVDSLLEYGKISAMAMFEYGRKYESMQVETE